MYFHQKIIHTAPLMNNIADYISQNFRSKLTPPTDHFTEEVPV